MALRAGGLGVWDWDPQARLLTLSDAAAEIVGQAPGVHGADALLPLIHPDDLEKARGEELLKASPSVPRTAFDVELRAQRGDGELRWFRVLASYVFDARGRFVRALGTVGDVTGRRRASDALLARERELRDLAEAVPHAVMVMDGSGRVLFRNALSTRLFDPARPDDMNEAIHPEDRAAVWQLFDRRSLAGRVPVTEGGDGDGAAAAEVLAIECRLRLHGAQEYRWYLGRALCVRDADGTVLRWYATATDIHANKVTEAALRERETRLRLAVAASRLGVWEWREESASFA
jgi:PAS domain S-box-containing protein